jgi:hypothetical protein
MENNRAWGAIKFGLVAESLKSHRDILTSDDITGPEYMRAVQNFAADVLMYLPDILESLEYSSTTTKEAA